MTNQQILKRAIAFVLALVIRTLFVALLTKVLLNHLMPSVVSWWIPLTFRETVAIECLLLYARTRLATKRVVNLSTHTQVKQ